MMKEDLEAAIQWVFHQHDGPFSLDAKLLVWRACFGEAALTECSAFRAKQIEIRGSLQGDGSFASKYGGPGSVLWSAQAIYWLRLGGEAATSRVLLEAAHWLDERQSISGYWTENAEVPWKRPWYTARGSELWITASVLQSLAAPASDMPVVQSMVERGLGWLQKQLTLFLQMAGAGASQRVLSTFGFNMFALGVCTETMREFAIEMPGYLAPYLRSLQSNNGSWENSLDVTQCVTHALVRLGETFGSISIVKALDYIASRQNADGSWSHVTEDPGDWTLTAYIARLFATRVRAQGLGRRYWDDFQAECGSNLIDGAE